MSLVSLIDPPALGKPNPAYAAITAAKLSPTAVLYTIAGQVAEDPKDGSVPTGFGEQIDLCLRRIDICLESIGATKADMTRFVYYLRQGAMTDYDAKEGEGAATAVVVSKAMAWLEGNRPASCYNRSFGMSDDIYHCEFEAMVVVAPKDTPPVSK